MSVVLVLFADGNPPGQTRLLSALRRPPPTPPLPPRRNPPALSLPSVVSPYPLHSLTVDNNVIYGEATERLWRDYGVLPVEIAEMGRVKALASRYSSEICRHDTGIKP
jgi:hypothetical protein